MFRPGGGERRRSCAAAPRFARVPPDETETRKLQSEAAAGAEVGSSDGKCHGVGNGTGNSRRATMASQSHASAELPIQRRKAGRRQSRRRTAAEHGRLESTNHEVEGSDIVTRKVADERRLRGEKSYNSRTYILHL